MPSNKTGWQKDKISSGQLLLIYNGGKPDIIFTDATKQIQSARGKGATVIEVDGGPPGYRLILAVYPRDTTIEHYLFGLNEDGSGTVVWGTIRANALITKSSSLRRVVKRLDRTRRENTAKQKNITWSNRI